MKSDYPQHPVLLVDDEYSVLESLEITLNMAGITNTVGCTESTKVMDLLKERQVSMVVMDLLMPKLGGSKLLTMVKEAWPELPVIIVTGVNEVKSAVECMKNGALDYVVKPVEKNELINSVRHALEMLETMSELESLKDILFKQTGDLPEAYQHIVGKHKTITSIIHYLHAIKHSRKPLLITGETGVGKDLIAKAFHEDCGETGKFVTVNVAGLDDTMFSDTLFGHTKGAFTGAQTKRNGMIKEAENGTLFLDEIGDLTMMSQVKLLRLLQNGEYLPLGSETHHISNARIICATNVDLEAAIENGSFRKDLYYRLKTHHVLMPALRERASDIPLLVDHFLEKSAESLGKQKPTPPAELYPMLKNYSFPGNIRELESLVHEAVSVHSKGILSLDVFKGRIRFKTENTAGEEEFNPDNGLFIPGSGSFPTMEEIERKAILEAMERAEDNQSLAAQLLGVSRHTIMRKLKQYAEN